MLLYEWEQFLVAPLYLLVTTSPAAPTIHSIKFTACNVLGVAFLGPRSCESCKIQLALAYWA